MGSSSRSRCGGCDQQGQGEPSTLPHRQLPDRFVQVPFRQQTQRAERDGFRTGSADCRRVRGPRGAHRLVELGVLAKQSDAKPGPSPHALRAEPTGQHEQQGRLPDSVLTDQPDPVARSRRERDAVEHPPVTEHAHDVVRDQSCFDLCPPQQVAAGAAVPTSQPDSSRSQRSTRLSPGKRSSWLTTRRQPCRSSGPRLLVGSSNSSTSGRLSSCVASPREPPGTVQASR
ncbi:hypothetical protein SAMN05421805_102451 [Saccharopolyspora antimicrobica]|uniref:Uncharacterized protein n=1 Tax=Saccharopolyspora antimicrobica TaxID=455193 RepID=A0A1I4VZC2_9PSEU|nr:hypothetical protein SAMN05421805_102451 [Saccharopolyspora antimicrobica]